MDSQNLIFLCKHKPQLARKTISQTIVHYGKKVIQKREVISELNQNILLFGARHPLVGESHLKMGLLHLYEGQFIDAILHLEEALNIKATFLGPNHSDFASILMLVAFAQIALERFDECIAVLLRVRRTREDAVGYSHPEIGVILNNVACVHYELGDFQRAEALFQEALDLQRETFTADPSFLKSVSALLCNIAFLHAKNGLFSKALIELEGALQIQQEILNDENNEVDAITANIAHIMAIQKMQRGSGNMEEITNQYIAMLKRH
jgi:tetratricopeptide (TPR) repeat protein